MDRRPLSDLLESMYASDAAELSSISTAMDELTERVTAMAQRYTDSPRDDLASRLFDAERSLRQGGRSIEVVRREMEKS